MQRSRLFLFLALFLFQAGTAVLFAENVLVKAESLTLREKADSKAKSVKTLTTYDVVDIKKRDKDWAQVATTDGKTGWVMAKYLTQTCFVSINIDKINVRQGPGEQYEILMTFNKGYPVKVLDHGNGWLKISDVDGDRGWITQKLVSFDPYVITKLDTCNVREGIGTDKPIVFTAEKNVLLKVLAEKEGWLHVKHQDGDEGWMSAKVVFGWLESDSVDASQN